MVIALVCYQGNSLINQQLFNLVDIVIAVDSGLDSLKRINVKPDYAIGDFDSLKDTSLLNSWVKSETIKLNSKKDQTDLRAAIDFIIKKFNKIQKIIIFTHFSGRIDQQLGVISQLKYLFNKNLNAIIYSNQHIIQLLSSGKNYLKPNINHQYYSFIAITEQAIIKNSIGLEYPLSNLVLTILDEKGISNKATCQTIAINIATGLILSIETTAFNY